MSKRKFYIVCGHYGSGKSNFSINLALSLADVNKKVMLLDLDLVNPYFLSSGYKDMLNERGVEVVAPLFANSNVDIPALPAEMNRVFEEDADVVMDVGGDDAGSVVLGRFASQLANVDYELLYVVNKYRNLTATPEEAVGILQEIQAASRCKASAIVNNSHLKQETTWEVVRDAIEYGNEVSKLLELPIYGTTIPRYLLKDDRVSAEAEKTDTKFIPIDIYVKAPWEYPEFN